MCCVSFEFSTIVVVWLSVAFDSGESELVVCSSIVFCWGVVKTLNDCKRALLPELDSTDWEDCWFCKEEDVFWELVIEAFDEEDCGLEVGVKIEWGEVRGEEDEGLVGVEGSVFSFFLLSSFKGWRFLNLSGIEEERKDLCITSNPQ